MVKEKQNKLSKAKTKKTGGNKLSGSGKKQFTILNMAAILRQGSEGDCSSKYVVPTAGKHFILKVVHRNRTKANVSN